ncbi:MAG: phosphoribosylanthranilate isomerase [Clostridia bacterium]|nr:phosphoribosylanthranilate isomerase [Clostridia bacterium]
MVRVKICGLKRQEDILYVNKYKPDYVGFVFAESKRRLGIEAVKNLAGLLDGGIKKAGIFVDESMENVVHTVAECSLDIVQIHGNEPPEYIYGLKEKLKNCRLISRPEDIQVWKAIRVKDLESVGQMKYYDADAFVLDAFAEKAYGGIGKTFDWKLAIKAKSYGRIILAGGLNPGNIKEAMNMVEPFGVDVSSGVETEGYKDEEKIRDFIDVVKEWR